MNHLEQLVSEWLQYQGYFVRVSVPVGPRAKGGFEGELDVVALHPGTKHLLHVECSLDAWSAAKREAKFATKFERGRKHVHGVFQGVDVPETLDQALVLQFAAVSGRLIGGVRLITVRDFMHEMAIGLKDTSSGSKAVSSNLPLLRTVQLVADAQSAPFSGERIVKPAPSSN